MYKNTMFVIVFVILNCFCSTLCAQEQNNSLKWPLPILVHQIQSELTQSENKKITETLLKSLYTYTNLAIYTKKQFSNQIGWAKKNKSIDCTLPDDCSSELKKLLKINHEISVNLKQRADGKYNLRLILKNIDDKREFVEVVPDVSFVSSILVNMLPNLLGLENNLKANQGVVHITSFPLGASVKVDQSYIGHTPLSIAGLDNSMVQLSIKRENHPKIARNAVFKAGTVQTIYADLIIKQGELLIDSDPSGATIILDNQNVGTTPKVVQNVTEGPHRVVLQLSPYAEATYPVEVKPNDITRIKHEFINQNGTLIVRCENQQGKKAIEIYLNGSKVSENEYRAELPQGQYRLLLVQEGFQTKELVVEVFSGKTTIINEKLESGLSLKPGQIMEQQPDYLPAIFTTVIGAMLTGFGAFVETVAQDHYSNANSMADTDENKQSELNAGRNSRIGGGILMGVGAGAVVAGVVLFFVPPMKDVAITPEVDPGKKSLKVSFNFKF